MSKLTFLCCVMCCGYLLNAQDSLHVKWLGSCCSASARKVTFGIIDGDPHLFVQLHGSVMILDIHDPTNPQKVKEIGHPGALGGFLIGGLAVVDSFLYVAIVPYGLWIYDIADPHAPVRIGECHIKNACGVAVSEHRAYVTDLDSGLAIIDISEPSAPTIINWLSLDGPATDVAIADTLAFVAADKLQIVNVADPHFPSIVGTWNPNGGSEAVKRIATMDHYVFLADMGFGFYGVDVADPQFPVTIGFISCFWPMDVAVCGAYCYGAAEGAGIMFINIADPHNAYLERTLDTPKSAQGVTASGTHIYVADLSSTLIIDVASSNIPEIIGAYDNLCDFTRDVEVAEDKAFIAYRYEGLRIADISDPRDPYEYSCLAIPGLAKSVTLVDTLIYVAADDSGMRIINVADPAAPHEVGHYYVAYGAIDVAVDSIFAYVAIAPGLEILDVTDPTSPVFVSLYFVPGPYVGPTSIHKSGHYVYLTCDEGALRIINVEDPYSPHEVGCFRPTQNSFDVTISDSCAYLTGPEWGFYTVDITDPSNPLVLDSLSRFSDSLLATGGVVLNEQYAFIGSEPLGVVDIADPSDLSVAGYYRWMHDNGTTPSYRVDRLNNCIFVAASYYGLQILEFTGSQEIAERPDPKELRITLDIFPNPCYGKTAINYVVHDTHSSTNGIILKIYDVTGRLINDLSPSGNIAANPAPIIWYGLDDYRRRVPPGVYFCQLRVGKLSITKKIILLE